jgi:molecular chaperone DnaK (HSP70)
MSVSQDPTPIRAVGIDLGTTFSCVGYADAQGVRILGGQHRTTPSMVSFHGNYRFLGHDAKLLEQSLRANGQLLDPSCTIYDAKRMIGKTFDEIQEDVMNWPFTVVAGPHGRPLIQAGGDVSFIFFDEILCNHP